MLINKNNNSYTPKIIYNQSDLVKLIFNLIIILIIIQFLFLFINKIILL